MEIKITWSTLAKQQLKDIGQYVADNFGERTANKSLERIVKKVNGLYVFPESGSFDKKYSTDSYTVRHLTIHPNVVYYIQFANQITIMAVAHEKQSPPNGIINDYSLYRASYEIMSSDRTVSSVDNNCSRKICVHL